MIKNNLKPLLLCLSILLFINSCTGDEELRTSSSEIQNIRNNFSLKHFNDDVVKNKLSIHWDDFNIHQNSENEDIIYEFNTSFRAKNTLENGNQTLTFTYKLLAFQNSDGNPVFELIKFLSDNANTLTDISYFDPASFSGTVYYYNLQGETTKIEAYKDGVLQNEFSDEEKGVITAQSKAPYSGCENGCYVLVFTEHYTDYYLSVNGGGFSYAYSVYEGTTSEWVWVSNSGGGEVISDYHYHADAPHGPAIGTNNHTGEHIVIDPQFSQEYPCQADIVQQAYGLCSPLTQVILNAFETNDGTNLVYTNSSTIYGNGNTTPVSQLNTSCSNHTCDITVKLRNSYLETATDLSIARTVIHESLHATLVYMVEEGLLSLPDGSADPDFADLVNAHINYMSGLPSNLGQSHHELMASFVEDIATSLSQYGQQNGYNLSYEFYNDIAWGGLTHGLVRDNQGNIVYDNNGNPTFEETLWFQLAVPNPVDRDRIINRLAAEVDNQTTGSETPSGQPCTN